MFKQCSITILSCQIFKLVPLKIKKLTFFMDHINIIHFKASIIFYFIYPKHIRDFLYVRARKNHDPLFSCIPVLVRVNKQQTSKKIATPQTSTPFSSCEQARKIEGVVFLIPSVWYLFARTCFLTNICSNILLFEQNKYLILFSSKATCSRGE